MCADMRNRGSGIREEQVLTRRKMGVSTCAKVIVCGDEVGYEDVSAIMEET